MDIEPNPRHSSSSWPDPPQSPWGQPAPTRRPDKPPLGVEQRVCQLGDGQSLTSLSTEAWQTPRPASTAPARPRQGHQASDGTAGRSDDLAAGIRSLSGAVYLRFGVPDHHGRVMAPTWPRAALPTLVAVVAIGVPLGCGGASSGSPVQVGASAVASAQRPGSSRVAVIVMENEEYGSVVGSRSAPFINRLRRTATPWPERCTPLAIPRCPTTWPYRRVRHSGSTATAPAAASMRRASSTNSRAGTSRGGPTWRIFRIPALRERVRVLTPRSTTRSPTTPRITHDPGQCRHIVGLGQLGADERSGALPTFIWITPNLCHDMHDCGVSTGDRFLATLVPSLLRSLGPHGVLFLTWDEGSSNRLLPPRFPEDTSRRSWPVQTPGAARR